MRYIVEGWYENTENPQWEVVYEGDDYPSAYRACAQAGMTGATKVRTTMEKS